jgi:hypothetical protein
MFHPVSIISTDYIDATTRLVVHVDLKFMAGVAEEPNGRSQHIQLPEGRLGSSGNTSKLLCVFLFVSCLAFFEYVPLVWYSEPSNLLSNSHLFPSSFSMLRHSYNVVVCVQQTKKVQKVRSSIRQSTTWWSATLYSYRTLCLLSMGAWTSTRRMSPREGGRY